jgi:hypothetical protein
VCRHLPASENTSRTTQQGSGADRKQELLVLNVPADDIKHLFVVHQRLLSIAAGHEQNIKDSCFRNAHIRSKPKPLHVANRHESLADDLNSCIRHARKNFKRSGKVHLIHPVENQATHGKGLHRHLRLRSLA